MKTSTFSTTGSMRPWGRNPIILKYLSLRNTASPMRRRPLLGRPSLRILPVPLCVHVCRHGCMSAAYSKNLYMLCIVYLGRSQSTSNGLIDFHNLVKVGNTGIFLDDFTLSFFKLHATISSYIGIAIIEEDGGSSPSSKAHRFTPFVCIRSCGDSYYPSY